MHAGNIFAALNAWLIVKSQGGKMVMRIEDLDSQRSKREYADKILRDFESLGLFWDMGPFYQNDRGEAYEAAYEKLCNRVYPCFCTRADLASQSAPHASDGIAVYSGRCRSLSEGEIEQKTADREREGRHPAFRLAAEDMLVEFEDLYQGRMSFSLQNECGDFIVRRSDGGFSYQIAVVVDDAEQGVTSVCRGFDLIPSTSQQIYLQSLLGFETPEYAHCPLFIAPDGSRLSKRNYSANIDELLATFGTPEAVVGHIAYIGGLQEQDVPTTPENLLESFDVSNMKNRYAGLSSIEFDIF